MTKFTLSKGYKILLNFLIRVNYNPLRLIFLIYFLQVLWMNWHRINGRFVRLKYSPNWTTRVSSNFMIGGSSKRMIFTICICSSSMFHTLGSSTKQQTCSLFPTSTWTPNRMPRNYLSSNIWWCSSWKVWSTSIKEVLFTEIWNLRIYSSPEASRGSFR